MEIRDGLADEGWAQMHAILDQELPQRKRRGLIWWMLAGVLFLGATSIAGYQYFQNRDAVQDGPDEQSVVVIEPNLGDKEVAIDSDEKKADELELAAERLTSSAPELLRYSSEEERASPKGLTGGGAEKSEYVSGSNSVVQGLKGVLEESLEQDPKGAFLKPVEQGEKAAFGESARQDSKEALTRTEELDLKEAFIDREQSTAFVSYIASRKPDLLPVAKRQINISDRAITPSLVAKRKSPISFAVALRADLLSDFKVEKLNAGGGIELQLGLGSRFKVITGLSYRKLATDRKIYASQNSLAANQVFASDCCDADDAQGLSTDRNSDQRFLFSKNNESFHMVEVPAQISYRIASRWDIHLGVHWLSVFQSAAGEDQLFAQPFQPNAARDSGAGSLYRNSNFVYSTGARYSLARHFFLDLRFAFASKQHVAFDFADKSSGRTNNLHNGIRLGVGYRF